MFEVAEAKSKSKPCHGISRLHEIHFSDVGMSKIFLNYR